MISLLSNGIKAGIIAGLFWGLLNVFFVSPIILKAETFEASSGTVHVHADGHHHHHGSDEFSPEGKTRSALTVLGNTLLGATYGALLSFIIVLGLKLGVLKPSFFENSTALTLILGSSAFLILHGLPSLGLPPPLPGVSNSEGDFGLRQNWWLFAVLMNLMAMLSLWMGPAVLTKWGLSKLSARVACISLSVFLFWAPFGLMGVPAHSTATAVPGELQTQFLAASLFVNFAFWIVLSFTSLKLDALSLKRI
ncbi:MAG: CbtA family protein [Bacteriovoracaceae bacterium]